MCAVNIFKMNKNKQFTISRTFSYNFIILSFVVVLFSVQNTNAYSNVRRSGSVTSIDEPKRLSGDINIPNITPMLRPASNQVNLKEESYNIEIKQIETIKPDAQNSNENKTVTSKDVESKADKEIEHVDELKSFKPISSDFKIEEFIKNQELKIKESSHTHKNDLIKDVSEALQLEKNAPIEPSKEDEFDKIEIELLGYVDETLSKDSYSLFDGVKIEPVVSLRGRDLNVTGTGAPRSLDGSPDDDGFDSKVMEKLKKFANNHVLSVNIPQAARFFGFKSFGLKKLLLPIFIGAQIVKSVLIAMFLPSILGSLGKIVGKGLSQFSGASTNFGQPQVQTDDMDYKDIGYGDNDPSYTYPNTDTVGTLPATALYGTKDDLANVAMSRFGPGGAKVTYVPSQSDNYYRNAYKKQEDYKVFHNIPASSLLLSNYDPFYSPLLSRLDSVFQRLGLGGSQASAPERCREKLVCMMYASPAKYAPYSNLVSAQLSRELNELRKPTSDNPEILRFFRYMKAAKDGQEGGDCARSHPGCQALTAEAGSVAMITTYNDINKLVSARKL